MHSITLILSIITSNIYTRLAACNCISFTFWSGDLPSPLMAIFSIFSIYLQSMETVQTFITWTSGLENVI